MERIEAADTDFVHSFSWALYRLKEGKHIHRSGWNGKGMYLYYVTEGRYPVKMGIAKEIADKEGMVSYGAYIAIKSVSGVVYIWNPSQQDLFADDWVIVE